MIILSLFILKNNNYRNILSTEVGYKKFIDQIKTFSRSDGVSKVELTDNYINVAGELVITAVYSYHNDIGKLIFMAGIDIKLDELEYNIIHNKLPVFGYDNQKEANGINSFAFVVNAESRRVILSS